LAGEFQPSSCNWACARSDYREERESDLDVEQQACAWGRALAISCNVESCSLEPSD